MSHFTDVKHFMSTFGQATPAQPTVPAVDIVKLRLRLIIEEFEELFDAVTITGYDEHPVLDVAKKSFLSLNNCIKALEAQDFDVDMIESADAFTDLDYVVQGGGIAFGIDLDKCFEEVHSSNMSKLDANGKPIRNAEGKVQKSELYRKPDLKSVLIKQGYIPYVEAT